MKKTNKFDLEILEKLIQREHADLLEWYSVHQRKLPWRYTGVSKTKSKVDPYKVWISEVMLQQTTVVAVIPYYEKFLKRFPTLQDLATSSIEEVLELWAGLGYYSRARNLHKAAQLLSQNHFPKTAEELIQYPGFGPYTSRAVASISFNDPVGVLDGNVIRVLCRRYGLDIPWWNTDMKSFLQNLSDLFAQQGNPSEINQALMELGATVCTPQKPICLLCPIKKDCIAKSTNTIESLPLKKARRQKEIWIWKPEVHIRKNQIALTQEHDAPFLKKTFIFPGKFVKNETAPLQFLIKHNITHHEIYVQPTVNKSGSKQQSFSWKWVEMDELAKINPSSLLKKTLLRIMR